MKEAGILLRGKKIRDAAGGIPRPQAKQGRSAKIATCRLPEESRQRVEEVFFRQFLPQL
jgi:hypothetical protein